MSDQEEDTGHVGAEEDREAANAEYGPEQEDEDPENVPAEDDEGLFVAEDEEEQEDDEWDHIGRAQLEDLPEDRAIWAGTVHATLHRLGSSARQWARSPDRRRERIYNLVMGWLQQDVNHLEIALRRHEDIHRLLIERMTFNRRVIRAHVAQEARLEYLILTSQAAAGMFDQGENPGIQQAIDSFQAQRDRNHQSLDRQEQAQGEFERQRRHDADLRNILRQLLARAHGAYNIAPDVFIRAYRQRANVRLQERIRARRRQMRIRHHPEQSSSEEDNI